MIWGAHKADGRIAAKNSVKIRAAIRRSIDARQIFEAYQDTQPFVTDNNVQDRARARAWAMLNVQVDKEPIKAALLKIWSDGFVLGIDSATEAVTKARRMTKAGDAYIDWANWTPGNRAAALLLRPTGAFEKLLADANITSNAIAKVGYDRIGTALADSIAAGFSPQKAARVMLEKVGDPARALTIAITEQNRAMSVATVQTYKDFGLEKVEWSGANPCDICAPNEGQVVTLGDEFESGDTEPPVHPNCRCALLPVIEGTEDDASLGQDYLDTPDAGAPMNVEQVLSQVGINPLMPYKWDPDIPIPKKDYPAAEFKKGLKEIIPIAESPVAIRVGPDTVPFILKDGRLKTASEVEKNFGGTMTIAERYKEARIALENERWGVPKNVFQPIYGYMNTPHSINKPDVRFYGDVKLVLKDSVKGRTTFTVGDSLNSKLTPIQITDALKGNVTNKMLSNAVEHASLEWSTKVMYIEAQIHGGVSISDIARVELTNMVTLPKDVIKALMAHGIGVTIG